MNVTITSKDGRKVCISNDGICDDGNGRHSYRYERNVVSICFYDTQLAATLFASHSWLFRESSCDNVQQSLLMSK